MCSSEHVTTHRQEKLQRGKDSLFFFEPRLSETAFRNLKEVQRRYVIIFELHPFLREITPQVDCIHKYAPKVHFVRLARSTKVQQKGGK